MSLKRFVPMLNTLDLGSVLRELLTIGELANRPEPHLELEVLYAEPKKLRAGMVVYADGTSWDPGSGEGMYRRNKANAAWVSIG